MPYHETTLPKHFYFSTIPKTQDRWASSIVRWLSPENLCLQLRGPAPRFGPSFLIPINRNVHLKSRKLINLAHKLDKLDTINRQGSYHIKIWRKVTEGLFRAALPLDKLEGHTASRFRRPPWSLGDSDRPLPLRHPRTCVVATWTYSLRWGTYRRGHTRGDIHTERHKHGGDIHMKKHLLEHLMCIYYYEGKLRSCVPS